jgi:hypothetical protein
MRKIGVLLVGAFAVLALPIQQSLANGEKVGRVDKLQGDAEAHQGVQKRMLATAGDVLFQDQIQTGNAARMEATLRQHQGDARRARPTRHRQVRL